MNIVIAIQHKFYSLVRSALMGQVSATVSTPKARPYATIVRPLQPAASVAKIPMGIALQGQRDAASPVPLRVLRVVDKDQPAATGRLVISGRMADVCAELDRLAAREAAFQPSA